MSISLQSDDPTLDQLSTLQLPTLPAGTPYLLKSLTDENIVETYPGDTHSESSANQPLRQLTIVPSEASPENSH